MKILLTLLVIFALNAFANAEALIAHSTSDGIRINLNAMADERVANYEIYRSPVMESEFNLIATIPAKKFTPGPQRYVFLDQDVKYGETYYYYYVEVSSRNSRRAHLQEVISATSDYNVLPDSYTISAYPNPFNPSTMLKFNLRQSGDVNIAIYDVAGRLISHLVDGQLAAGEYRITFNGENLPSGMYIARMESKGFSASQNLMLMK